jgi:7-cyano-7-deazaguanine reductase
MKDEIAQLTKLGTTTKYTYEEPSVDILEVFENKYQNKDYIVHFEFNEFTSLCPKTGQPDFGEINIQYIPNEKCIETKSLKLYFLAFRQHGSFMETITNKILEDCFNVCKPRWMQVIGSFNTRGGVSVNVKAEKKGT